MSGWLTFDVPDEAEELMLETDLERPSILLRVPTPKKASPRDKKAGR